MRGFRASKKQDTRRRLLLAKKRKKLPRDAMRWRPEEKA